MTEEQFSIISSYLESIQINLHFIGTFIISLFCVFFAFIVVKFFLSFLRKFL